MPNAKKVEVVPTPPRPIDLSENQSDDKDSTPHQSLASQEKFGAAPRLDQEVKVDLPPPAEDYVKKIEDAESSINTSQQYASITGCDTESLPSSKVQTNNIEDELPEPNQEEDSSVGE